MAEDEMVDGHEFEQALGDSEGQRSLACCSPWGCEESDTTERLNTNKEMPTRGPSAGQIAAARAIRRTAN